MIARSHTLKDDSLSEPGSAVPFTPFQSPLSSSLCAFLSGQGARHTLPQAFRGQCTYLETI